MKKKFIDAYVQAIVNNGSTDNLEYMVEQLLKEIKDKNKDIESRQRKLDLLKKLQIRLHASALRYKKQREDVATYLSNFDTESGNYFDILNTVESLNTDSFYDVQEDDDIIVRYILYKDCRVTPNMVKNLIGFAENTKDMKDIFEILKNKNTSVISSDIFLKKLIGSSVENYRNLLELNEVYLVIDEMKKRLAAADFKYTAEGQKCEYDLVNQQKKLRQLLSKVYYGNKENKDAFNILMQALNPEKAIQLGDVLALLTSFYKETILPNIIKDSIKYINNANVESEEECNLLLDQLNHQIVDEENQLHEDISSFKSSFILDVIDYIYPGIKEQLIKAIETHDYKSLENIKETISGILTLDDLDTIKRK